MKKVFVNGCFDCIHRGHIHLLNYSKSLGDVLYVAIDSDERVKQLKGFKPKVFAETVDCLAHGRKLPKERKDHQLTVNLRDFRECHLAPDILLVYQIDDGILVLTLVCIGNHAQLFK